MNILPSSPPKENLVSERSLVFTPGSPPLGSVMTRAWKKPCFPALCHWVAEVWKALGWRYNLKLWLQAKSFLQAIPHCLVSFLCAPLSQSWRLAILTQYLIYVPAQQWVFPHPNNGSDPKEIW